MRSRRFGALLILSLLGGGCDDEKCWWEWYCYWDGDDSGCYWVYICRGDPVPTPREFGFEALVYDAGGGRVDIRVDVGGDLITASNPVSVMLTGSRIPWSSSFTRWWFHGLPAGSVTGVEAHLVGTSVRRVGALPSETIPGGSGCEPLLSIDTGALPDIPASIRRGEEIFFLSPPSEELLASGLNRGFVVALFPPVSAPGEPLILAEGHGTSVRLDEPGTWLIRLVLLTSDLCEPDTANVVVLGEAEVLVQQ